ncbi:hypothetical protein [Pararhizobium gei]|uniref:hypothetical protein n=1 Tax=Pararhizobium gei TaxID=1395951 RepID=UPI0023DCBF0F|nr:hypothetical protein [Rhizobium gei]
MRMPHLPVTGSAVAVQTPARQAATTSSPVTLRPPRSSANPSDAILKILEILNRQMIGSQPLPKEALARLLETLSKILKFPPLLHETPRDFTKRLAVFLETLPPAARLALEKQLGQRNLTIAIRVLVDAIKGTSIVEAARLADRLLPPVLLPRPLTQPAENRPAISRPVPGTLSLPIPIRQPSTQQPLPAAFPLPAGPQPLQVALKAAFGVAGETTPRHVEAKGNFSSEQTMPIVRSPEAEATRTTLQLGTENLAIPAAAGIEEEPLPVLRAAVAFLAADAAALSLVSEIASGDIDSRLAYEIELEQATDSPPATDAIITTEQPEEQQQSASIDGLLERPVVNKQDMATAAEVLGQTIPSHETASGEQAVHGASLTENTGGPSGQLASLPDLPRLPDLAGLPDIPGHTNQPSPEVDGFRPQDLGEWDLEVEPHAVPSDSQAQPTNTIAGNASAADTQDQVFDEIPKDASEAGLLPEGETNEPGNRKFSDMPPPTSADIDAEAFLAQFEPDDVAAPGSQPSASAEIDRNDLSTIDDGNPTLIAEAPDDGLEIAPLSSKSDSESQVAPSTGRDKPTPPANSLVLPDPDRQQRQRLDHHHGDQRSILNTLHEWTERPRLQKGTSQPQIMPLRLPAPAALTGGLLAQTTAVQQSVNHGGGDRHDMPNRVNDRAADEEPLRKSAAEPKPIALRLPASVSPTGALPAHREQAQPAISATSPLLPNHRQEQHEAMGQTSADWRDILNTVPDWSGERMPPQDNASEPGPLPLRLPAAKSVTNALPAYRMEQAQPAISATSPALSSNHQEQHQATDQTSGDWRDILNTVADWSGARMPPQHDASEPQSRNLPIAPVSIDAFDTVPVQFAAMDKEAILPAPSLPANRQDGPTDGENDGWRALFDTIQDLTKESLPLLKDPAERLAAVFKAPGGSGIEPFSERLMTARDARQSPPDASPLLQTEIQATEFESEARTMHPQEAHELRDQKTMSNRTAPFQDVREVPLLRHPDPGFLREAFPFAMIPYLPAVIRGVDGATANETEEELTDEDEETPSGDAGKERHRDDEVFANTPDEDDGADGEETADAYDLYRHMGGLG